MTFFQFMKWLIVYRQKFIRPLWYIYYDKDEASNELEKNTQWKQYGGHHLENRASSFAHQYWLPKKFSIHYRILKTAADVREGRISREKGISVLEQNIEFSQRELNYVLDRLGISEHEFKIHLDGINRNWTEFNTYKRRFEILRPVFFMMMYLNLVPKTFYQKYCKRMTKND